MACLSYCIIVEIFLTSLSGLGVKLTGLLMVRLRFGVFDLSAVC